VVTLAGARPRVVGLALLVALIAMQAALMATAMGKAGRSFNGDENYYVAKARALQSIHRFPRLQPPEYGNPFPARFWGDSDWRPPGYPMLLAAATFPDVLGGTTRGRVAWIQFAGVAGVLALLFLLAVSPADRTGWALAVALALGAAPWPFAFASLIGPESAVLVLATVGAVLLALYASGSGRRSPFVLGVLCLSLSFIFRPEGIVLVPFMVILAIAARSWRHRRVDARSVGDAATAALVFVAVLSVQILYRVNVAGRFEVFGPARFSNEGALAWIQTWFNTEENADGRFAHRLSNGRPGLSELPSRAFRDDLEKAEIGKALEALARGEQYDETIDRRFAEMASKRRREAWFGSIVGPSAARTVQLWVNLSTSTHWLSWLATTPRPFSRTVVGGLLAAKLLLLAAAALAIIAAVRNALKGSLGRTEILTLMLGGYVVGRTLVIGLWVGLMVARYMVSAWPGLLWCSVMGFRLIALRLGWKEEGR
jgi:hypothetical protein